MTCDCQSCTQRRSISAKQLKIGEIVKIRRGKDLGRLWLPASPILVKVHSIADDSSFNAVILKSEAQKHKLPESVASFPYCYSVDEVIEKMSDYIICKTCGKKFICNRNNNCQSWRPLSKECECENCKSANKTSTDCCVIFWVKDFNPSYRESKEGTLDEKEN